MLAGVAVGCRALLVVVLGLAFAGKISSRAAFRGFTDTLTALPWPRHRGYQVLAITIIAAEGASVVLIAVPVTALTGLVLATVLLVGFTVVPALALRRRVELTCRCFGLREAKIGPSHVLRNGLVLCAALAGLTASLAARAGAAQSLVAIGIGMVAGIVFVGWDELAYVLRPSTPAPRSAAQPHSHTWRMRP